MRTLPSAQAILYVPHPFFTYKYDLKRDERQEDRKHKRKRESMANITMATAKDF
jgi:hypothetical protein